MDLTPYVDRLRRDLADAAAAAGPDVRAAAERLALALDPATRMMLIEALSQASAEITGELDHDVVDVRMHGREPELVVTRVTPPEPPAPPAAPPPAPEPEDVDQSRITLRLPVTVKARAEESAAGSGLSLNAWLVEAVRDALDGRRIDLEVGSNRIRVSGEGRRRQVRGWVQ